jgi:hypothetical protein
MRQFELSFNPLIRIVMTVFLTGPRRCRVVVTADRLSVVMGVGAWAFAGTVARSSVTQVARVAGPVWAWGAHGWRGRWLVNGSSRGLVEVTIQPAGRGRCLVVPVRLARLTVSLEEPDEFIAALT